MFEKSEFEEQVASYWEEREDFDARTLTSALSPRIKKLLDTQAKAGNVFKKLQEGIPHESRIRFY